MPSLTYSVAIRTLGTSGEKFRRELVSIQRQTVQPERVVVYIAEGYARPDYTVGQEEYVWVRRGMMAQRALRYDEIDSDCILLLDDDVELSNDSAARLLQALTTYQADCVGADTFQNHRMTTKEKMWAAITNLVFPHWSKTWAFKMHRNGSFSYNNHPTKSFYLSQTCAGPASLWRKSALRALHFEDELWLDRLGFPYGEDALLSYKAHKNGMRMGVLYDAGIENLDAGTSSQSFRQGNRRMYVRSFASFAIWWRTCFRPGDTSGSQQLLAAACFAAKALWLLMGAAVITPFRHHTLTQYIGGMTDAWRYVHSAEFRSLPAYVLRSKK